MYVVTLDQIGSRRAPDRVPALLAAFESAVPSDEVALPFERTAGDEVQGLLASAVAVRVALTAALREAGWRIGLGIGDVDSPLPDTTRAARGAAYLAARRAVERAGSQRMPVPLAVEGPSPQAAHDLEAAWHLLAALLERRTAAMWEAIDVQRTAVSHAEAASALGITVQAFGQRLRRAGSAIEESSHSLLDRLAEEAARA